MLDSTSEDRPIHYPSNPDKFEFDTEVAQVFDNMAQRSIPLYDESRRLTTEITTEFIQEKWKQAQSVDILDVGASTGAFYKDLWKSLGYMQSAAIPGLSCLAVDSSLAMVERMLKEIPAVYTLQRDAETLKGIFEKFDIVNLAYVVQFIPQEKRADFWNRIFGLLKWGGMVFVSGKYLIEPPLAGLYDREYMAFRRGHGYTDEEIAAKTRALKGSMWPETFGSTIYHLQQAGFSGYHTVCSWLQFTTIAVFKNAE